VQRDQHKPQIVYSQDGCQTNSRRYDGRLFINGVNKMEDFSMTSFL